MIVIGRTVAEEEISRVCSRTIEGYQLYHNYIRKHMSLDGNTPASKAGIIIEGENKWKTIIENASKRSK